MAGPDHHHPASLFLIWPLFFVMMRKVGGPGGGGGPGGIFSIGKSKATCLKRRQGEYQLGDVAGLDEAKWK